MTRTDEYCAKLQTLDDWVPYLVEASNLPGPRGNLELAHAAAQTGMREQFELLLGFAPVESNTPQEFLVFCGVLGLGKLASDGDLAQLRRLRAYASDKSWRIREAAATALQFVGDRHTELWLSASREWSGGNWLEKRASAAALAEPRLLKDATCADQALEIIQAITTAMFNADNRSGDDYRILRKAMGYCWSVVVAALPEQGKSLMEAWVKSSDPDIRWIMRENLKKDRLLKTDQAWVEKCREILRVTRLR